MRSYPVHELAKLIPDMTEAEYIRLRDDIRQYGQRVPIAILEGALLDGRHRFRACNDLDIDPKIVHLTPETNAANYVLSHNVYRRNLTESQVGLVVAGIATWTRGGDRRSAESLGAPPSRGEIAVQAGISPRTADRGAAVLKQGTETVVGAVRAGEISLHDAVEVVKHEPEEQDKAVQAVQAQETKTASQALKPPPRGNKPQPETAAEPPVARKPIAVIDEAGPDDSGLGERSADATGRNCDTGGTRP